MIQYCWEAVTLLTADGRIQYTSPAMGWVLGYLSHELVGRTVFELVHPEDRAAMMQLLAHVVHAPGMSVAAQFRYWTGDGSWRWIDGITTNLLSAPHVHAIVANYRDVIARKQAEEAMQLAQAFAAQAATALHNARLFAHVQRLSRALLEVQERERHHLARELHDELGQMLTALKLRLGLPPTTPADRVQARLCEARALAEGLITQVRELSLRLRPAMLDDLGLVPALQWYVERYETHTQIAVTFRHSGLEGRLPPAVETAVYRVIQEAPTNIARHARVRTARVQLWVDAERLYLEVADQGVGFAVAGVLARSMTSGLAGMRERVALVGGQHQSASASAAATADNARTRHPRRRARSRAGISSPATVAGKRRSTVRSACATMACALARMFCRLRRTQNSSAALGRRSSAKAAVRAVSVAACACRTRSSQCSGPSAA
jgi:PAS domain S-box-containing protein